MKLTSDNKTLAESRALILYILNKVSKPVSNDTLFRLILGAENMNYFYFQQFLLDLSDKKFILSYSKNNETFYELTKEGIKTLELTKDLIPGMVKLRVDESFKKTLENAQNAISIQADFTPESENSYIVNCKIVDNGSVIFELKTFAGSREQAKLIVDNWTSDAEKIYPKILKILTK